MTVSFAEMQERLQPATLRELIVLVAAGVNGRTFNELAAVRERFLGIAFRDAEVMFSDRSLAAVWSRALDSVLLILLEKKLETKDAYIRARNASKEEALQFGFGSVGQMATSDAQALMRRLSFSGEPDQSNEGIRSLRAHLADIAFGVEDEPPSHDARSRRHPGSPESSKVP